ncbi:MAG TPA: peptide ABC transporter permease, partial [Saliniramus sp.]|nr:peptide ABC transporter permease [Saliniramus sp.]
MARHRNPVNDPVASATALLRRLGFATLMLVIPSLALVSRRAVVVLAPIGITLLIIAAILDGENRPIGKSNRAFAGSVPVLATIVLLVWIALSLLWTPFPEPAAARVGSILAMTALVVAGYYALPDRMRASNIYLLPIGVSVAAIAGIALSSLYGHGLIDPPDAVSTLELGLVAR